MVVPKCQVLELVTQTQPYNWVRVTGVRVRDAGGNEVVVPLAQPSPDGRQSAVVIALGTIESTRLALTTFQTSLAGRAAQRMGSKNLMVHLRSNLNIRVPRASIAAALPALPPAALRSLQVSALFVKSKVTVGGVDRYFHLQITASGLGRFGNNSETELFKKVPSLEQLNAILQADDQTAVITLRGIGEMTPQNPDSFVDLAKTPTDWENGRPRAFVDIGDSRQPAGGSQQTQVDRDVWEAMDAPHRRGRADLRERAALRDHHGLRWADDPRPGRCHRSRPCRAPPAHRPTRPARHHPPRSRHAVDERRSGVGCDERLRPHPRHHQLLRGRAGAASQGRLAQPDADRRRARPPQRHAPGRPGAPPTTGLRAGRTMAGSVRRYRALVQHRLGPDQPRHQQRFHPHRRGDRHVRHRRLRAAVLRPRGLCRLHPPRPVGPGRGPLWPRGREAARYPGGAKAVRVRVSVATRSLSSSRIVSSTPVAARLHWCAPGMV
jgi:hypothetical protein